MKEKNSLSIKFRISPKEYRSLKSRAGRYYKGNVSKFIRDAIEAYKERSGPKAASPIVKPVEKV